MAIESVIIPLVKPENVRLEEGKDYFYAGDYLKASKLFTKLIDEGIVEAYYFMGVIYELGNKDVKKDLMKSIFYYTESADLGFVESLYGLGRLVYCGIDGVGINYTEAFRIYTALNEAEGHTATVAKLMLGRLYQFGRGVDKDLMMAKKYYIEACELGNIPAIEQLASVEKENGHRIKAIWLHLKYAMLAGRMTTYDSDNPRLREC